MQDDRNNFSGRRSIRQIKYRGLEGAEEPVKGLDNKINLFQIIVDAMEQFAEISDMSIFELYAGLGTYMMLEEGLLEIEVDE